MQNIGTLMKKYGIKPKHNLGQNFLVNDAILEKILSAADLKKTDNVLEVGAGLGALTRELIQRAKRVLAVEIDRSLVYVLKQEMRLVDKSMTEVKLVEADILKLPMQDIETFFKGEPYKIVANIPYQITSHFLRRFLDNENPATEMVLLVQKEVGQRIVAKPGDMNLLALSCQYYAEPRIITDVAAENFLPVPEVDSVIIKLADIKRLSNAERLSAKNLFRIARIGFSAKRKQLQNNLSAGLKITKDKTKKMLLAIGLKENARAEDLSVEDWERLSDRMSKNKYQITNQCQSSNFKC
ncbi:ribosomal RNA small subunit methyltransferase A [Candidatus Falkowbacteria bacterium]|nr:ribosomal RNA small subunit methyltransferase A [Candidatus Falkowbacteria bacterium]